MTQAENTSFYKQQEDVPLKLKLMRGYIKLNCFFRPEQTLEFLVDLFATPRTDNEEIKTKCEDQGVFQNGDHKYVKLQGDELFLYHEGQTDPDVLLIPGWESSAYRFVDIIEKLRECQTSFLFFDLPAQGKSGGTHNDAVKTSKIITDILMMYPSIKSIIGHSFGGGSAYLALSRSQNDNLNHVKSLVTVSSPTSYRSVINRFNNFLGVPERIQEDLLDEISKYIGYNFRDYDWIIMDRPNGIEVNVFHDLDDPTIPVRDAIRVNKLYEVEITEGNGHSNIMHNEDVVNQIIELVKNNDKNAK